MLLEIGQGLTLSTPIPPDIGEGSYILLSPPTGHLVRWSFAGEDDDGDICRTSEIVEVKPGGVREFELIPDFPLIE